MDMEHRLASIRIGVYHHTISSLREPLLLRDPPGKEHQSAYEILVLDLIQRGNVCAWDHNNVCRGLGSNVTKPN